MANTTPRSKLWLERDGRLVMSSYRMRLLALVDSTGSLARAAEEMGLSYRRAWGKVKEIEENLGFPIVESVVGGPGGGHTALTPQGHALLKAYADFESRAEEAITAAYDSTLAPTMNPQHP